MIRIENLRKEYDAKTVALDGIDLELDFGRIVGLLGPNGSGKTTLLKLANGLLQPTEGRIRIAGMAPGPETKELVSYLPDADWLPDWMRVEELVEMFRDFYGTPSQAKAYIGFDADKANEMLARLNIAPNARLKTLSKGNKEKVQLVLAMSRNARLYLLDEPIGGVDPAARDYILNTIISNYSKDATVVISTHLIEDIEPVLDEAVFLKDGNIFGLIQRNKKGLVVCVNKWDLVEDKSPEAIRHFEAAIRDRFAPFVDFPILFTSALTKQRIFKVLQTAVEVYGNRKRIVPTSQLNTVMLEAISAYPPPANKGKYVKIKYVTMLKGSMVPTFIFFCNLPQWVKEPYRRYLENKIRENWDYSGTPINVFMREK